MGPLQMPCVFGAVRWYSSECDHEALLTLLFISIQVHGFSTPCMFKEHSIEGRHDECPYFPEADLSLSESSVRLI